MYLQSNNKTTFLTEVDLGSSALGMVGMVELVLLEVEWEARCIWNHGFSVEGDKSKPLLWMSLCPASVPKQLDYNHLLILSP